jgi:hypothetical protein
MLGIEATCWQWASIMFGFLSAALWFSAALVRTPTKLTRFLDSPINGGAGIESELSELAKGVTRQSRLNAWAAILAALALICQAGANWPTTY